MAAATIEDDQYAAEQERLREQLEGTVKDIRIDAPKDPEVNPEVYKDVEPLLFRGFLAVPAEINNVSFVFKSLNHHEFELLELIGGRDHNSMRYVKAFIAYSVFMIDGQSILPERDRWVSKIADVFGEMPQPGKQAIIRHLSELNRRTSVATILTEAFAMERTSRFRWAQLQGEDLTRPGVTGISGTSELGMNWGQLLWRAINNYEDQRERMERDWDNSKFIGSCFAGKGLQKVYQHDTDRRTREHQEMLTRKDRVIRHALFGESLETTEQIEGGQIKKVARTVEELASQLEKDLRGDKDFHDRVVEAEEKRIRDGYQAREKQLAKLASERDRDFGQKQLVGNTDFSGLTPQQIKERVRQDKRAITRAGNKPAPELNDPRLAEFMQRWNGSEEGLIPKTDKDTRTAFPVTAYRRPGRPTRR